MGPLPVLSPVDALERKKDGALGAMVAMVERGAGKWRRLYPRWWQWLSDLRYKAYLYMRIDNEPCFLCLKLSSKLT
jgi:hypothetical protein